MTKLLSITLLAAFLVQTGLGQTSAPASALPPVPLIVLPKKSFLQWTVDFTYAKNPKQEKNSTKLRQYQKLAENDPALAEAMSDPNFVLALEALRPKQIVVTKTGDIRHEERHFEGDLNGEVWSGPGFTAEKKTNTSNWIISLHEGVVVGEFPEFNWISRQNFTGLQTEDDRTVEIFKQKLVVQEENPDEESSVTLSAKVDAKTHLPMSLERMGEMRIYTFLPPPSQMQVIPPEVTASLQEIKARIQQHTKGLSPP